MSEPTTPAHDVERESPAGPAEARYLTLPELSPYLSAERYEHPKELFRHVVRRLHELTEPGRAYRYADIACANGEFLYYLQSEFPHWQLHGFDYEPAFLDVARAQPSLEAVRFELVDLFEIDETHPYDIVSLLGVMSTFQDPEPVLAKLLALCASSGLIFIDGYFNEYDVEVRSVYSDNSTPEGRGKWRVDWTQHTQAKIGEYLEPLCQSVEFEEVVMGVELPRDPAKPHIDAWTFRDADGKIIITNGTRFMLNDVMLTVRR